MADLSGSSLLPQGTRILWESVPASRTFSLGFFFPSGSRLDPPGKAGLAHLVEHLVFKGTQRYSAFDLARTVDRVGGDLNAWTDREEMAFTCTVPAEHRDTALAVLLDLCFAPRFPETEFEREKEVIRNEILASLEDPEELSYDEFLRGLDPGAWTNPVAGTTKTLAALTLDDVRRWWANHIRPETLTVVAGGDLDAAALERQLRDQLPARGIAAPRQGPAFEPGWLCRVVPAEFQMVQVLGSWHFPKPTDARQATVWQVFSLLWGETMSSRLFQGLRERKGLCYSVSSQVFDTASAWGVHFFATGAPEHSRSLVVALKEEVDRLASDPPSAAEWEDARLALRGGMVLGAEKAENRVHRLWRLFDSFGATEGFDAALAHVDVPVTDAERQNVLELVGSTAPSLQVWGKTRLRSSEALKRLWAR